MSLFLEPISSTANPKVRAWVRLQAGKHRRQAGRFLVDGAYETTQGIEAGIVLEEILLSEVLEESLRESWMHIGEERGIPLRILSKEAFAKVSVREKPEGVIGIGKSPDRSLSLPEAPEGPLLVASGLEKPGNLGALIRTAYAAGAAGVILCDPAVDFENPQVIRSSRGLVFKLPGWTATAAQARDLFRERGWSVFAADKEGACDLWEIQWGDSPVIVLGEEHAGLPEEWMSSEVNRVRIPMREGIDSLNVSVSGALLLYEWKRKFAK